MGKNWCVNGTLVDTDRYSSPVPFIGLYTATATLVCLILILCDIWLGFRRKKLWFPCRFFSLNSISLTLISISTKLPVDLTSPMPSSQDQLSKLTGTVFICLTMTFLMPSTGTLGDMECYSNLVALSIFIFTVIVNICVQIATGIIFSFIVEHAIILFCMLLLMASLWITAFLVKGDKEICVDGTKNILKRGPEESLLERVKVCYLHAYGTAPQFHICASSICASVSLICVVCLVILGEVLIRSLAFRDLNFCDGVSAYGWSVWSVVGTQVVCILAVSFVIGGRWLKYADRLSDSKESIQFNHDAPYLEVAYSLYLPQSLDSLAGICIVLGTPFVNLIVGFVVFVSQKFGKGMRSIRCLSKRGDRAIEDFKHLPRTRNVKAFEWILREAVEDMERLMQLNTLKHQLVLMNLLSTTNLSRDSLIEQLTNEVSSLSILLLVEMAKVSLPNSLVTSMMENIIAEVFPVIYFIDGQKGNRGFDRKVKYMTAKFLVTGNDRSFVMHPKILLSSMDGGFHSQSELACALGRIGVFDRLFVHGAIRLEGIDIANVFLCRQRLYLSLNELSDDIKLLFVAMLSALLSQLPMAIFNHVDGSPPEEYEERLRLCLKFICKVESLEPYVTWSFPTGCDITGLSNVQAQANNTQSNYPEGNATGQIDYQVHATDTVQSYNVSSCATENSTEIQVLSR